MTQLFRPQSCQRKGSGILTIHIWRLSLPWLLNCPLSGLPRTLVALEEDPVFALSRVHYYPAHFDALFDDCRRHEAAAGAFQHFENSVDAGVPRIRLVTLQ